MSSVVASVVWRGVVTFIVVASAVVICVVSACVVATVDCVSVVDCVVWSIEKLKPSTYFSRRRLRHWFLDDSR